MIDDTEPIREFNKDIIHNKINELYPFLLNDKKIKINELFMKINEDFDKSDIDKYKEKLQLWKEEELSPLQIQFLFKIDSFDKKLVLSISPQTENEKTEYFKWLVDYLHDIFFNKFSNIFDFKSINSKQLNIIKSIEEIKEIIKSKLNYYDIKISLNDYENYGEELINNYLKENSNKKYFDESLIKKYSAYKSGNFYLSELGISNEDDSIYKIKTTALEIAFVLNELEAIYILENNISNIEESNNEGNYNEYLINKNKTFNSNLNKDKLIEIYKFLENDYILSNKNSEELFIKLFSNSNISEFKKDKIIWIKSWGKSITTKPILKLIRILCNPKEKFYDYRNDIGDIITLCFKFQHKDFLEIDENNLLENFRGNISENISELMTKDNNINLKNDEKYDDFEKKLLDKLN